MRPPIVADNCGDITLFETIDSAERFLEPIDIRNQEYELFDADGNILRASISQDAKGVERVELQHDDSMRCDESKLRQKLFAYLQQLGLDAGMEDSSLSALLRRVAEFAKEK
jgi:hypothetical protein